MESKFPQIPHPIATVFCTGKEGSMSLSIVRQWDYFYVADEHGEGKYSESLSSENLAFEAYRG
jgi:hypothetical protein